MNKKLLSATWEFFLFLEMKLTENKIYFKRIVVCMNIFSIFALPKKRGV
jgi:hypothetical protein